MGGVRPGRVITGWLVLVGLYTVLTQSDRVSEAVGLGNTWITALSDPTRPLIREHGKGGGGGVARLWSGGRHLGPTPTPITVPHSPWIGPPLTNPFQAQGIPPRKSEASVTK